MKYTDLTNENIILYHGSSEPSEYFKKYGLKPSRHGSVFLTDNPELAIHYAETDQERTGNDNITIISVNSNDLNQNLLMADIDHTNAQDWRQSLKDEDQCMYMGEINSQLFLNIEEITDD